MTLDDDGIFIDQKNSNSQKMITRCLLGLYLSLSSTTQALEVFDMEAIRDPATLEVEVLQDWRTVEGPVALRTPAAR